jgi:hypothetical protein
MAKDPLPKFEWPHAGLERLWQNNLGFFMKVLRPQSVALSARQQFLALLTDVMLGQNGRAKERLHSLSATPRTSWDVFWCARLCEWTGDQQLEKDWLQADMPGVIKRAASLHKDDVGRLLQAGQFSFERFDETVWDVATLACYAQSGADTQLKFEAGAVLDNLRPQFEKAIWHKPNPERVARLVWPLGLLSPAHPDVRKLWHARAGLAEKAGQRLVQSAHELYALHAMLLTENALLADACENLLKRPMMGSMPEFWHPLTGYGGAGQAQDPEASMLTLWLLARMLLSEAHDALWLLPGLPLFSVGREWVFAGQGLTSRFGGLDLWTHMNKHGELDINIESRYHSVPKEIKLRCPSPPRRVEADGKNVTADGMVLRFGPRVKKIHIAMQPVSAPAVPQEVE